jgi:cyclophilin family peptidyl-prolyl cis-trans isomerase
LLKAGRRVSVYAPVVLFLCVTLFMMSACGNDATPAVDADVDLNEPKPEVKKGVKPEADNEVAVIEFEEAGFGQIVVELYPNVAPKMVERFKQLAREGFYNGTAIHRVEPFVIQMGDPNSRDDDSSNDGMGGSQNPDLPPEFSDLPYEAGVVGAARAGINTANSQFFVTLKAMPQWAGSYTAFGRVIKGLNDARVISGAPVKEGTTNPDPKIVIKSVTLQPRANFQ